MDSGWLSGRQGKQIVNDYGIRTICNGSMEEAEAAITDALKAVGFGILTRIDVAATLKSKIGVERKPYVILGACNPKLANDGLHAETELGLFLPCNVIVYQNEDNQTVVSAIDPLAMVGMLENSELNQLVEHARPLLQQAVDSIKQF
ncbi:MAG: ABC transporter ATP-binding protein [Zetaproteobacteria bacterium CG1_02_53_45]|nr:MAG: ABC transporter ATP-binding protein [Zetaproteobacteria bacterium CG1_02_53_45]